MSLFLLMFTAAFIACQKNEFKPYTAAVSLDNALGNVSIAADNYTVVSGDNIGLIGDGQFDNTDIINQYLTNASYVKLVLSPGIYIVNGLRISSSHFALDGNGSELRASTGTSVGTMVDVAASDVSLSNFSIDGSYLSNSQTGVTVFKKSNVTLSGISSINFGNEGILLSSSNNVTVSNCTVDNCTQGIEFWGGDAQSAPATGTSNISVLGCRVTNTTNGGIWGSNGENILLDHNSVSGAGDVGIDLEGCRNSTVTNNSVANCGYAAISLFYDCNHDLIQNNQVGVNNGQAGIRLTDASGFSIHDIQIDKNTISSDNSYAVLLDEQGSRNIDITNNSVFGNYTNGIRSISNNSVNVLSNGFNVSNCVYAISNEGGSYWNVNQNRLITNTTDNNIGQTAGILLHWSSSAFPANHNSVSGNDIEGFDQNIINYTGGDNSNTNVLSLTKNSPDLNFSRSGQVSNQILAARAKPAKIASAIAYVSTRKLESGVSVRHFGIKPAVNKSEIRLTPLK